ncbi:MAG: hypothetical protein C0493_02370 [Kytococcus sp.]|nr:hypothetical protein [Kytococcus sp.]
MPTLDGLATRTVGDLRVVDLGRPDPVSDDADALRGLGLAGTAAALIGSVGGLWRTRRVGPGTRPHDSPRSDRPV